MLLPPCGCILWHGCHGITPRVGHLQRSLQSSRGMGCGGFFVFIFPLLSTVRQGCCALGQGQQTNAPHGARSWALLMQTNAPHGARSWALLMQPNQVQAAQVWRTQALGFSDLTAGWGTTTRARGTSSLLLPCGPQCAPA